MESAGQSSPAKAAEMAWEQPEQPDSFGFAEDEASLLGTVPAGRLQRKRKKPQSDASKLSDEALREAALAYLDRYDASVEQLRRILHRRVQRYRDPAADCTLYHERIEQLLARFGNSKLVDDERFATGFIRGARARGASALKVHQKLRARGINADVIDDALCHSEEHEGLDELAAARTYARKKNLRRKYDLSDPSGEQKALASLARQGFSFETAREALQDEEDESS